MNKNDYIIRLERKEDRAKVENLVREAFWNVYRPGCLEHYVLHQMRNAEDFVPELAFVMEKDGEIIGQNVFVKAKIKADDGREIWHRPRGDYWPVCTQHLRGVVEHFTRGPHRPYGKRVG